jgi:hypothetical protein
MKSSKIKLSELKELIKKGYMTEDSSFLNEKKKDEEDKEEDVEIEVEDDEEVDMDIDVDSDMDDDMDMSGGGDEDEVLKHLIDARKEAKNLGDEKLLTQIGNTITYFTRKHIAKTEV